MSIRGDHDFPRQGLAQFKDGVNHLLLFFLNDALLLSGVHQGADFLLGDQGGAAEGETAEGGRQSVAHPDQQADRGPEDSGQDPEGSGEADGPGFRTGGGDALRHQPARDQDEGR